MVNHFIASYVKDGKEHRVKFDNRYFTKDTAAELMKNSGFNMFFFLDPIEPKPFGANGLIFSGEVGFDITVDNISNAITEGKDIFIDSKGGSLNEGYKIYDAIKMLGTNPNITVFGVAASAATIPLLATENSSATENSRLLIHNPWVMEVGDYAQMKLVAAELEMERDNLAALYAKNGADIETIKTIMAEERILTPQAAFELGLIKKIENMTQNSEIKDGLSKIESMIDGIKNLFKPKNMTAQTVDGKTLEFPEVTEPELIAVGVKVNVDGAPASGEFTLANGDVIVAENGTVTEIRKAEDPELLVTKQQLTEAQTEITNLKEALKISNEENEKLQETARALVSEVTKIKALVSQGEQTTPPATPSNEGEKGTGFSFNKSKFKI